MSQQRFTKSAGGIVLNEQDLVLIVSQHGDSWSLPKGHIDPGETVLEAAKREIYEESGINDLIFIKELGTYTRHRIGKGGIGDDESELKEITIFVFKTHQIELNPIDEDNPEAIWVTKNEVVGYLTHKKDKEFFLNNIDRF